MLLASTALILGALADWVAAWGEGTKHLQRSAFYLLCGLAFATAGGFLDVYAPVSLQWLILLAALHASAFGLLGIVIAVREKRHGWERRTVFLFGAMSIVFSGTMAGLRGNWKTGMRPACWVCTSARRSEAVLPCVESAPADNDGRGDS